MAIDTAWNNRRIIENTEEEKQEYCRHTYGGGEIVLSQEELKALSEGKCLAIDDDEYATFVTLSKAKEEITWNDPTQPVE